MIIRNPEELSAKGNVRGRSLVLDIIEHAMREVNFFDLTKNVVQSQNNLRIGELSYDSHDINRIFVVGGGKHVTFVAAALEQVIGDRIIEGVVVEKKGWARKTERIKVVEGGHPVPDSNSMKGAEEVVRMAEKAQEDDLVLVCVTGGCTSLTALPPNRITLDDLAEVFDLLLRSGAPIEEMNAVRKHLSQLGGGKLATLIHPAMIVSLIAVDEVAGLPWGPTVPDTTTFSDATGILKRYGLWNRVPQSIREYFERADPSEETPKKEDFDRVGIKIHNLVLADNRTLCAAAQKRAIELGLNAATISTSMEGEARDVGTVLASIAREIEKNGKPFEPPCVLIAGGETTVSIMGESGEGGRNQELALSAARRIAGSTRAVIASIGTDGTDGPTDVAGALVDGYTLGEASRMGVDIFERLKRHDSLHVFKILRDAIYTEKTGTNLMDLMIVYVGKRDDDTAEMTS
jgi:glycerate 2-kinase